MNQPISLSDDIPEHVSVADALARLILPAGGISETYKKGNCDGRLLQELQGKIDAGDKEMLSS